MKTIVEKLLNTYFGKFITGVDRQNLQFSLLSGQFKVSDISLNETYFDSLDIPVRVSFSHIGQLEILAPISRLGSVTCVLSDLFVILEFKDEGREGGDKEGRDTRLKQSVMEKYARGLLDHFLKKVNQEKEGMMKGVFKKIVNNLEMKIRNVHVRFEEKREKTKFSFGMTLKQILFLPTDQHWNIQQQSGQKNIQAQTLHQTIYKKMKIQGFNLYWDESSTLWLPQTQSQIMKLMKEFITSPTFLLFHISTDVRVKIQNGKDQRKPLYELSILLSGLDVEVTRTQIQQILMFVEKLTLHSQLKLIMRKNSVAIDEGIKETFQKYIKQLVLGHNHHNSQIEKIYQQIPAAKLYEWVTEIVKVAVKEGKVEEQKKKQAGWFNWWKNSGTLEDLEDEISLLLEDEQKRESTSPLCAIQLKAPEGKLRISSYKNNTKHYAQLIYNDIELFFNLSTDGNSISFNLALSSLQLDLVETQKDKKTTTNILKTNREAGELFQLTHSKILEEDSINMSTSVEVSKATLTLKPMTYKKMKEILNFGDVQEGIKISVLDRISEISESKGETKTEKTIKVKNHISVNVASPQIILPCSKGGYYRFNIGIFCLDSQNQKYQLSLSETGLLYYDCDIGDQNPDYLIDNMTVNTTVVTSDSGKNISVVIPNVSMRMSKDDFSRLLELYELFNDSKAIRLKSKKDRRAYIENNKEFQHKITLKSSSGGWKNDYLIVSGYFIYVYEHQNSLEQSLVIPIKGLKCEKEQQKLMLKFDKDGIRYILKHNQQLQQLIKLIQEKNIELASEAELIQLFTDISSATTTTKQFANKLTLQIPSIRIRYNTIRPIFDLYLKSCQFTITDTGLVSDLTLSLKEFQIQDLMYHYQNSSYQPFIVTRGPIPITLTLHSQILKQHTSKTIDFSLPQIDLNWKPQLFLQLHSLLSQYSSKYSYTQPPNIDYNWKSSFKRIHQDTEFVDVNEQYERSETSVKADIGRYRTAEEYEKHESLVVWRRVSVKTSVMMQLFHRETHVVLGKVECKGIECEIVESANALFVKGQIEDLLIYEMGDFTHSPSSTPNKPSHLILSKTPLVNSPNILSFTFSSFKTDQFINTQRLLKFLNLRISSFSFHYYHQYTMRLFDYFFIQIIYVLTQPELVIANKNLVEQLVAGEIKEEIAIVGGYDEAMKKLVSPFFTDITIQLSSITLYLKPHQLEQIYFISEIQSITIQNQYNKTPKRVQNSNLHQIFKKYIWEENYTINIQQISFRMLDQQVISPTNLRLNYNSCQNDKLVKYLFPDIKGLDQGSYITGKIDNVAIEFTRKNYLNFIKFINFNILYQDSLDHLYNHNYVITKLKTPKPILVSINITNLTFVAKHNDLTILQAQSKDFTVSYHRTEMLHKIVSVTTKGITVNTDDHPMLRYEAKEKDECLSLEYRIQNTNKRSLSVSLENARILASFPTLSLLSHWLKLEPWVDTAPNSHTPQLTLTLTIKNISFALKTLYSNTLFLHGDILFESFHNPTSQTSSQIQIQLQSNKLPLDDFHHPLSTTKCQMNIQLFRCTFKDFLTEDIAQIKKRTVVNKTEIVLTGRELLKFEPVNRVVEPSSDIVVFIGSVDVDFSMADILLFQKLIKDQKPSQEILSLISSLKSISNPTPPEKQIFSSIILSIPSSTLHLINNIHSSFVPLLTISLDSLHLKLNHNKQIIELSLLVTLLLKYYNTQLMVWEPFLEGCEVSVESRISLVSERRIVKVDVRGETMVTISKGLVQEIEGVVEVVKGIAQGEKNEEELEIVEYVNSVVVVNYTGYDILLNNKKIQKDSSISIKILFQNGFPQQKDILLIQGISPTPIKQNILHCQSTKKYDITPDSDSQRYVIVKPIIRNSKKHILIKSLYQLITKENQHIYFPIPISYNTSLTHNSHTLPLSLFSQSNQNETSHTFYTHKTTKQAIIVTEEYKHSLINYLPFTFTVDGKELKSGEAIKYSGQFNVDIWKEKYKVVRKGNRSYVTCQEYVECYDQGLEVLNEGRLVEKERVANGQGQFVKNLFVLRSGGDKLESRKNGVRGEIPTRVGKQTLKIDGKEQLFQYNIQTKMIPTDAGIQKIITISPKYILVNSTNSPITIHQTDRQIILKVNQRKIFHFSPTNKTKIISLTTSSYKSNPLSLLSSSQNFLIRSNQHPSEFKSLCCDHIFSGSISYFNFSEQVKYSLKNDTQYYMTVYQKHNRLNTHDHFIVKKGNSVNFAFDDPRESKRIVVEIAAPDVEKKQEFLVDLDDVLFEQEIEVNNNCLYLNLTYTDGFRQLALLPNKFFNNLASVAYEIEINVSSVGVSVVGLDNVRKELLYCYIGDIDLKYQYSANQILILGTVQKFNIQNTRDITSVNQNLIYSKINQEPFLQVRFEQDADSPKVINYFGISVNQFIVALTSKDIQVLKANFGDIGKGCIKNEGKSESIMKKTINSSNRYYIDKLEIHPLRGTLSYKSLGDNNSIIKTFANVKQAPLRVNGVFLTNLSCRTLGELTDKVIKTYTENWITTILPLLGNISILGSPASLLSKLGTGFKEFVQLPVEGFIISPLQGGKGIARGTKGLLKNTLEGTMNSVGGISESIGSGLAMMTLDPEYEKQRQAILNRRSHSAMDRFMAGGQSLYKGIESGMRGMIQQPLKGAQQNGVAGFLLGGFKGITGLVIKPVSGMLDMTSKTMEGIKTLSSFKQENKTHHHAARVFYNFERQYRVYCKYDAKLNERIKESTDDIPDLSWIQSYQISSNQVLIVSCENIILFDSKKKQIIKNVDVSGIKQVGVKDKQVSLMNNKKLKLLQVTVEKDRMREELERDIREVLHHHHVK